MTRHLPFALIAVLVLAAPVAAAPCTTATDACVQWIDLGSGHRSLVYSSQPLNVRNAQVRRAVVLVHGAGRNADDMFRTGVAAAIIANALEDTVVVSIRFASRQGVCRDALAEGEVNWDCGEGSSGGWRAGAPSNTSAALTSFDLTDAVVRTLAREQVFPGMRRIVVAGFSAGGQHVNRYAMTNTVHEQLRVPVTYVVGSPSSYGYPDAVRPERSGAGFGEFADARNCTTFNQWPFGLEHRSGYASRVTDEQLRRNLVSRETTYLIGELEGPDAPALDVTCPAMAQGRSRLERGRAFLAFIAAKYAAKQTLTVVGQCGHNGRCVFTAPNALPALFPEQ
ncbi:MAG: alpha/beta fold hydrolase [Acidimicrobiia bacterium]|nr:alpha/beta fold hydrolase [Acidimicrobiia bacterium]